jgi:3-dehydroquinate dehydratase type I
MDRHQICGVITNLVQIPSKVIEQVDLFELRIDCIGKHWIEIVPQLCKPWIATNRPQNEGGYWRGNEMMRQKELFKAIDFGASIIDIELHTPGLCRIVEAIKKGADCLISYHNYELTPPIDELTTIFNKQLVAGADICKIVTRARFFEDNLTILKLIKGSRSHRLIAFAMGQEGLLSRVLCPLIGGEFTYATLTAEQASAEGQPIITELKALYDLL